MEYQCLYCGKETLQEQELAVKYPKNVNTNLTELLLRFLGFNTDHKYFIPEDKKKYVCSDCHTVTTQTVFIKDNERTVSQAYAPEQAVRKSSSDEPETLKTALKFIKTNRSQEAFDLLLQHGFPLEHAAEFLIYRDVSQLIPCLSGCQTGQRYWLLEAILNNLRQLDVYLPYGDEAKLFQALTGIYEALLKLGREPINNQTDYRHLYTNYGSAFDGANDHTYRRRTDVLIAFAERLEAASQKSERHSLDYLEMALEVWHTCLDEAREEHGNLLIGIDTQILQLAPSQRRHITAHIRQLNPIVKQHDPDFIVKEPQKGVFYLTYWAVMLLSLGFCAVIGFLAYLSVFCKIDIVASKMFPFFVILSAAGISAFLLYQMRRR